MVREGGWTEKQLYPNKKSWKQNRFFYPLMFQFPLLKVFPILLWSVLCRHRWYSILGSTQSHRTGNLENLIICCKNYICHHQKSKLLLHFQDFHFLIDLRINLKSNIWRATIWFQNLKRTREKNGKFHHTKGKTSPPLGWLFHCWRNHLSCPPWMGNYTLFWTKLQNVWAAQS